MTVRLRYLTVAIRVALGLPAAYGTSRVPEYRLHG